MKLANILPVSAIVGIVSFLVFAADVPSGVVSAAHSSLRLEEHGADIGNGTPGADSMEVRTRMLPPGIPTMPPSGSKSSKSSKGKGGCGSKSSKGSKGGDSSGDCDGD